MTKTDGLIRKTVSFTPEECKYLEQKARESKKTLHAYIRSMVLEKLTIEHVIYKLDKQQSEYEQLHYENEMIQASQFELVKFLLVQIYAIQKKLGMDLNFDKDNVKNEVEKADKKLNFCKTQALEDIVQWLSNNGVDPLCLEEFQKKLG